MGQTDALEYLKKQKEEKTTKQIAKALNQNTGTTNRNLARLVEQKEIQKIPRNIMGNKIPFYKIKKQELTTKD